LIVNKGPVVGLEIMLNLGFQLSRVGITYELFFYIILFLATQPFTNLRQRHLRLLRHHRRTLVNLS